MYIHILNSIKSQWMNRVGRKREREREEKMFVPTSGRYLFLKNKPGKAKWRVFV